MNKIGAFVQCALGWWRPPSHPVWSCPRRFCCTRSSVVCLPRVVRQSSVVCSPCRPVRCPPGGGGSAFGFSAFARRGGWSPPALRGSGRVRCALVRLRGLCRGRGAVGRCGRPCAPGGSGSGLRLPRSPGGGAVRAVGGAASGGGGSCAASLWSPPCAPGALPRPSRRVAVVAPCAASLCSSASSAAPLPPGEGCQGALRFARGVRGVQCRGGLP